MEPGSLPGSFRMKISFMFGTRDGDPLTVWTAMVAGEEVAFSDPDVSDARRAAAGRETAAERTRGLLAGNRERAAASYAAGALPEGQQMLRVWCARDPADLRGRLSTGSGGRRSSAGGRAQRRYRAETGPGRRAGSGTTSARGRLRRASGGRPGSGPSDCGGRACRACTGSGSAGKTRSGGSTRCLRRSPGCSPSRVAGLLLVAGWTGRRRVRRWRWRWPGGR